MGPDVRGHMIEIGDFNSSLNVNAPSLVLDYRKEKATPRFIFFLAMSFVFSSASNPNDTPTLKGTPLQFPIGASVVVLDSLSMSKRMTSPCAVTWKICLEMLTTHTSATLRSAPRSWITSSLGDHATAETSGTDVWHLLRVWF